MSDLRILHAPVEIAGQMGMLSRAQRKLGYCAYSCSYANSWLGYQCDISLYLEQVSSRFHRQLRKSVFFTNAVLRYNTFHFHFGGSLLPLNCDLPVLKALGKKMIMQYWGSDIRRVSIAQRKNKFARVKVEDEKVILDRIKRVARYIDTAVVASQEASLYVEDLFKKVVIIRQAIELDLYSPAVPSVQRTKPVIVHAPTNSGIKGTKYICRAIERLQKKYDLEFILVQGIPHQQAKQIYQRADIIVDQLLLGGYGIFAIESMALGKPVICYISEYRKEHYPSDLPIVSANPDNIYDHLKLLVENPALRHELGLRGRRFVEKYHDPLVIATQLIELYKGL